MPTAYDLAVIGGGPGGVAAALAGAEAGLDVLLVDARAVPGGTDVVAGRHAVRTLAAALKREKAGAAADPAAFLREAQESRAGELGSQLADAGVERRVGRARLAGPGRLLVIDEAGVEEDIGATKIILAVGSRPSVPFGLRADGERILTSDQILTRFPWPRRLVVAGAGCVGTELAQLARQLGCQVTLLEMQERILPGLETECAGAVTRRCREAGIAVRPAHRLTGVEAVGPGVRCRVLNLVARAERPVHADALLVALGRRPSTSDLGLETVDVTTDRSGRIQVDGYMETATKGLYAVGDLAPTPQLCHLAAQEGRIAALHAAGRKVKLARHDTVPRALDTMPRIASVGLTAAEARARGHLVAEGRWAAEPDADPAAHLVKIVLDAENERLLGLQAVGEGAESLAAVGAALIDSEPSDLEAALPSAGPLALPARSAWEAARNVAPAVRAHVDADLERRPLRRLAGEAN